MPSRIEVTTPSDREIRTSRSFKAPRTLVWDCHTQPDLIRKWMLGPPGWSMPVCAIDLKVGGKYRYVLEGPNGMTMGFGGHYAEIVYPGRIVTKELYDQDWTGGETTNTLVMSEAGGMTTVTQTILYASKEGRDGALKTPMADGMEAGYAVMDAMLDQLAHTPGKSKITPFLWYDGKAEEAARFYCSVFGDSRILSASPMVTVFEIEGQKFMALNGGPMFKFTEAVSFYIHCNSQAEIDYFWDKLRADGGAESMCGWLKDKYGLSWQVIPEALPKLIGDGSQPEKSQRAVQAMMKMRKIDIAAMERAFNED